ncbi:unnamed protein product [Polarella glacialis]|uniref:CobW C-terminal domain-containing protein n=1 Tax=Polarella glacialis TaxID=89957 RepID=A0A813LSC3_POLGL|nr:unnamed protein product [Polarella glacialis]
MLVGLTSHGIVPQPNYLVSVVSNEVGDQQIMKLALVASGRFAQHQVVCIPRHSSLRSAKPGERAARRSSTTQFQATEAARMFRIPIIIHQTTRAANPKCTYMSAHYSSARAISAVVKLRGKLANLLPLASTTGVVFPASPLGATPLVRRQFEPKLAGAQLQKKFSKTVIARLPQLMFMAQVWFGVIVARHGSMRANDRPLLGWQLELQVQQILSEIVESQEKMKTHMKDLTRELLSKQLDFEQTYIRVREVQPDDPLERCGLSMSDFDMLLSKYQHDPKVKEGIARIMGVPTNATASAAQEKAQTVPARRVIEVHAFMLEELEKLVQHFATIKNKDAYDMKTVTLAAQAVVGAKVEEKFGLTSEDIERAVIQHHSTLATDQDTLPLDQRAAFGCMVHALWMQIHVGENFIVYGAGKHNLCNSCAQLRKHRCMFVEVNVVPQPLAEELSVHAVRTGKLVVGDLPSIDASEMKSTCSGGDSRPVPDSGLRARGSCGLTSFASRANSPKGYDGYIVVAYHKLKNAPVYFVQIDILSVAAKLSNAKSAAFTSDYHHRVVKPSPPLSSLEHTGITFGRPRNSQKQPQSWCCWTQFTDPAVIENEFGSVSIDDALLKQDKMALAEKIVVMDNGCMCCTVRGDLIAGLRQILDEVKKGIKIDTIMIETTGMADPVPIVRTFMTSPEISGELRLDGVITVADAKHILARLDDEVEEGAVNEAYQQVAFCDKLLLNKLDLVSAEYAIEVKDRLRSINAYAKILPCVKSRCKMSELTNLRAHDMTNFINEDIEKEAETVDLQQGHSAGSGHGHGNGQSDGHGGHGDGHDPDCKEDHGAGHGGHAGGHGHSSGHGGHGEGHVDEHGHVSKKSRHDSRVNSMAIVREGNILPDRLGEFMQSLAKLPQEKGTIFRIKGILSIKDHPYKHVFHAVMDVSDEDDAAPWAEGEKRVSKMVFIGKGLDHKFIREGFEAIFE